jgi:hypothetical protein
MQIITSTPTSKATTAALINNKHNKPSGTYATQPIMIPVDKKQEMLSHTPDDEPMFNIVYTAELITPPPSPKGSMVSQSFEANDRILTAKRQGQLKMLMSEYAALKKESLLFTDHTYNLIFDTYASLRRDGTPLTPMLKSKPFLILINSDN